MKIAYIFGDDPSRESGVIKKIRDQIAMWRLAGHEVRAFAQGPCANPSDPFLDCEQFRRQAGSGLNHKIKNVLTAHRCSDSIKNWKPDLVYTRLIARPLLMPWRKHAKVVFEINTNIPAEQDTLRRQEIVSESDRRKTIASFQAMIKSAAGYISVTNCIFKNKPYLPDNKPKICIPNGINFDQFPRVEKKINPISDRTPTLVFIGSQNCPWHGVDLLVNLAKSVKDKLKFKVIGPQMMSNSIPSNIELFPEMQKDDYQSLLMESDIGLGSLAIFRAGLEESSTLKIREYAAFGLPVICPTVDSAFVTNSNSEPSWSLSFLSYKGNICDYSREIVNFSNKFKDKTLDRSEVEPFFSAELAEERRLKFFEDVLAD